MKVALIASLWLFTLVRADVATTEDPPCGENADQSLVTLVVNLARELQKQECQLQQQASQLQEQASQLQEHASQLQRQGSQLQTGANERQQQSALVESLEESARALGDNLERTIADLTALSKVQARQGQQSSFRAVLPSKAVAANTPIHFGLEFAMGLGGYNPDTGIYTAPVSGLYLIGFQLYPDGTFGFLPDLFINGTRRIRSHCSNKGDTSCGASSFFRLQKGATVWLQTTTGGQFWHEEHSFFFGALVSPEP